MIWIGMTIKKKEDCNKLRKNLKMEPNESLQFKDDNGTIFEFTIDKDGYWHFSEFVSNLGSLGWVSMELAADNNSYDKDVNFYIWKYRRYINEFLNRK